MKKDNDIRRDLNRLARFGGSICGAHTCFIFLPETQNPPPIGQTEIVSLAGYCSCCGEVLSACSLTGESGSLGAALKQRRVVMATAEEQDAGSLGMYSSDQKITCWIAVPFALRGTTDLRGLLVCDSTRPERFSKRHEALLGMLAEEIANTLALRLAPHPAPIDDSLSWQSFLSEAQLLVRAHGIGSIEVLRIRPAHAAQYEKKIGAGVMAERLIQAERLIEQALPQEAVYFRMPTGELFVVLDDMLTPFIENKIRAICAHVFAGTEPVQFDFIKSRAKGREKTTTIETLIAQTCPAANEPVTSVANWS